MATATTTQDEINPPEGPGLLIWMQKNLFSNWYNSLLTILSLGIIYWITSGLIRFIFAADWTPVTNSPLLYLVGQYPRDELWRMGIALVIMSILFGMSWRKWGGVMRAFTFTYAAFLLFVGLWPSPAGGLSSSFRIFMLGNILTIPLGYLLGGLSSIRRLYILIGWLFSLILTLVLIHGTELTQLIPVVPTNLWGGLLVTMILAIGGIILSFPIGVLLALGRRSSLPVVKFICIAFIEVIRGVPLIGLLFLSSLILPLFLPVGMRIDRLLRALVGMILFSAAYTAENVRGGLAAVPAGQTDAAKALGHSGFQITILIVLPQALRAVIPPIVGQFISLFKDTTLASGVAVLELLAVGRSILQSEPAFIGLQFEVYGFIAAVFWLFSYLMSYASQRLEIALGVGER